MSTQNQSPRHLILSVIAKHVEAGIETLLAETGLERKVFTSNVNACINIALPLVARKRDDAGTVAYRLTVEGKKWVERAQKAVALNDDIKVAAGKPEPKTQKASKISTAAADQPADDKPGVSETTPEAAIAEGSSSPSEGAVRPENAPSVGTTSQVATEGGDGLERYNLQRYLQMHLQIRDSLQDYITEGMGHIPLPEIVSGLVQSHEVLLDEIKLHEETERTGQELLDKAYEEVGLLLPIVEPYCVAGEPVHDTVRTMDMLIDAQCALIEQHQRMASIVARLSGAMGIGMMSKIQGHDPLELFEAEVLRVTSQAVEDDRQIEATYDVLAPLFPPSDPRDPSDLGLCVVAKAVADRLTGAHDASVGPYVISAGYQVCDGLEAANEAAVQLALASTTGTVVIARPLQVAEVRPSIQPWEATQCAAATARCSS